MWGLTLWSVVTNEETEPRSGAGPGQSLEFSCTACQGRGICFPPKVESMMKQVLVLIAGQESQGRGKRKPVGGERERERERERPQAL